MTTWTLDSGMSEASFDLDDGARLTRLRLAGRDVLVTHAGQEPMWWGSFVMAPWTSLLRDGAWLDGVQHDLQLDPADSAWHGVARHSAWSRAGDTLTTPLSGAWPWGGVATLAPKLEAATLSVTLTVTATESRMPAAVGWHPWFVRQLDGVEVELHVPEDALAQERDLADAPTGRWVAPTRQWNDCVRTRGPIDLRYPGVGSLRVEYSSEFVTLFSSHEQGVCVEPVTSAAERLDDVLDPGESVSITISVTWFEGEPG